ncbi:hypothetical protein DL93DRAFT_2071004 [Clavulina sp. PMI_390]|nr:hypothetical protein DL93DRAFT_2071004 [Clavulina sp. PMI_390]
MAFDLDRFEPFWKESVVPFAAKDGSGAKQTLGEGTHVFPFQFHIPKRTTPHSSIVFDNVTGEHDLPPSFIEARNAITIQYILLIEVKFGFMKINREYVFPQLSSQKYAARTAS